jgi:hypothetical protein
MGWGLFSRKNKPDVKAVAEVEDDSTGTKFTLAEEDAASEELPQSQTEIVEVEPWQGILPCCRGREDGCTRHNPNHLQMYFDEALVPGVRPSGNLKETDTPTPTEYSIPDIWSSLPREPDILATLPQVHKSLPWLLSFYQVNAIMDTQPGSVTPLSKFHCSGLTGSNPTISWVVKPLIDSGGNVLLEYALAFTVEADLGNWTEEAPHAHASAKNCLTNSGYKNFDLCPHMRRAFKSHWGEGKNRARTAGVDFTLKNSKGKEVKGEWRSDKELALDPAYCTKCYTDSILKFALVGNVVVISVLIHKDVGRGLYPPDSKWLAATKGVETKRDPNDFGRMQREFEEHEAGITPTSEATQATTQCKGVEVAVASKEINAEDVFIDIPL